MLAYFSGGGVWCLTPLATIIHLNRGGQFYWGGTDLPQVTDKLYHIM